MRPLSSLSSLVLTSDTGSNRIPFPSYVWQDLDAILHARLEKIEVFAPHAIQRIARLVAGVSGDARRALDIARSVLPVPSPARTNAPSSRTVEKIDQRNQENPREAPKLCSMQDVSNTYKEMTNYGSNAFVKRAGLHQKIFLLALSQSIKRAGVPEVDVGDVRSFPFVLVNSTDAVVRRSFDGTSTSFAKLLSSLSLPRPSSSPSSRSCMLSDWS